MSEEMPAVHDGHDSDISFSYSIGEEPPIKYLVENKSTNSFFTVLKEPPRQNKVYLHTPYSCW